MSPFRHGAIHLALSVVLSVLVLLGAEAGLRVTLHLPLGYFNFLKVGPNGLYLPHRTILMNHGPIPYVMHTNALGMRGREIASEKRGYRLAAIGDSITNGFFVDDEVTYPAQLEEVLRKRDRNGEVLNVTHGGGSIPKEFALWKEIARPLHPDMVILTFVTNDLTDLRGLGTEDLSTFSLRSETQKSASWLQRHSAVGELASVIRYGVPMQQYLLKNEPRLDAARYDIPGSMEVERNVDIFNSKFSTRDSLLLYEPFHAEVQTLLALYFQGVNLFDADLKRSSTPWMFVYFPAYPQIYDARASLRMNEFLRAHCARLGVPFLDLTPILREKGALEALYLAPKDFHLNPRGYRVMAEAIADFLEQQGLLTDSTQPPGSHASR